MEIKKKRAIQYTGKFHCVLDTEVVIITKWILNITTIICLCHCFNNEVVRMFSSTWEISGNSPLMFVSNTDTLMSTLKFSVTAKRSEILWNSEAFPRTLIKEQLKYCYSF